MARYSLTIADRCLTCCRKETEKMFNVNDVKPTSNTPRPDYGHLETGTYAARIVQIIGLGVQERRPFQGEQKPPAPFIRITFELPYETIEITDRNCVR